MPSLIRQGIVVGGIVAAVTWISQWPGHTLSLFPDLISLLTLVVLSALTFRKIRHISFPFTVTVSAIVALSTGLRGAVGWTQPPDPFMIAITVAASFVVVLVVTNVVGWIVLWTRSVAPR